MTQPITFEQLERDISECFTSYGYPERAANAIAHDFSGYMLGYIAHPHLAALIEHAGTSREIATSLTEMFHEVRDHIRREVGVDEQVSDQSVADDAMDGPAMDHLAAEDEAAEDEAMAAAMDEVRAPQPEDELSAMIADAEAVLAMPAAGATAAA